MNDEQYIIIDTPEKRQKYAPKLSTDDVQLVLTVCKSEWRPGDSVAGEDFSPACNYRRKITDSTPPQPDATDKDPLFQMSSVRLECIIRAAISISSPSLKRESLWSLASRLFCVGSTSASRLCIYAGFDPDSTARKPKRLPSKPNF